MKMSQKCRISWNISSLEQHNNIIYSIWTTSRNFMFSARPCSLWACFPLKKRNKLQKHLHGYVCKTGSLFCSADEIETTTTEMLTACWLMIQGGLCVLIINFHLPCSCLIEFSVNCATVIRWKYPGLESVSPGH